MLSAVKAQQRKNKQVTDRSWAAFFACQVSSVCVASTAEATITNQKRPMMRVCCLDACSKGASAAVPRFFSRCWCSLQQGARAILREQGGLAFQQFIQVCGFEPPCCRFGTGSRGGAVGDAVCGQSRAAEKKKNKSLTGRGLLFLRAKFQRCFVLRAPRKQKPEPEAANNAGLLP